MVDNVTDWWRK